MGQQQEWDSTTTQTVDTKLTGTWEMEELGFCGTYREEEVEEAAEKVEDVEEAAEKVEELGFCGTYSEEDVVEAAEKREEMEGCLLI